MIKLRSFCKKIENSDADSALHNPFTYKGFTYASNGFWMIAIPGELEMFREYQIPYAIKNFLDKEDCRSFVKESNKYIKIPFFPDPKKERCEHCAGRGRVDPCEECSEVGFIDFSNEHHTYTVDCKSCNTNTVVPGSKETCECCDGEGFLHDYGDTEEFIRIGGMALGKYFLMKLKQLPLITIDPHPNHEERYIRFVFFGGSGILMNRTEKRY